MPVFPGGNEPARTAYGIERVLAHAMPTPTIVNKRTYLLWITETDSKPSAPQSRQRLWVLFRPSLLAIAGSAKEKAKHTAE